MRHLNDLPVSFSQLETLQTQLCYLLKVVNQVLDVAMDEHVSVEVPVIDCIDIPDNGLELAYTGGTWVGDVGVWGEYH